MAQGNQGQVPNKVLRKHSVWSHHGKRKNRVVDALQIQVLGRKPRRFQQWFSTAKEAFENARRRMF